MYEKANKQRFIDMRIGQSLEQSCEVLQASADVLLVKSMRHARQQDTVLVVDDTHLLDLLYPQSRNSTPLKVYIRPTPKVNSKTLVGWDICQVQEIIFRNSCVGLLFAHATSRLCHNHKSSRFFGVAKTVPVKRLKPNEYFCKQVEVFRLQNSKEGDTLDIGSSLRLRR